MNNNKDLFRNSKNFNVFKPKLDRKNFWTKGKLFISEEEPYIPIENLPRKEILDKSEDELALLRFFQMDEKQPKEEFTEAEKKTYNKTILYKMSEVIDLLGNENLLNYNYGEVPNDFGSLELFEKQEFDYFVDRKSRIYDIKEVLKRYGYKIKLVMHNKFVDASSNINS